MEIPLQIQYRDLVPHPEIEERIRQKAAKLERICDHIIRCRVALERPHKHPATGSRFRVLIELTVPPGHEIVVDEGPLANDLQTELVTVINNAFRAAERQLVRLVEKQRGQVKTHDEPRAFVVRLFRDEGYGFVRSPDNREIYFHRNSVIDNDWERLEVGTQVRFEEEMGEMGPQATTVHVVDKPGSTLPEERPSAVEPPLGWARGERDNGSRGSVGPKRQ
jgi:cold shock CspA family protein